MTEIDPAQPAQPGSGTEAPAAPGAEVDTGRRDHERQGSAADQDENPEASGSEPVATKVEQDQSAEPSEHAREATSPVLEHVKETIGKAEHAAEEALAPQRE